MTSAALLWTVRRPTLDNYVMHSMAKTSLWIIKNLLHRPHWIWCRLSLRLLNSRCWTSISVVSTLLLELRLQTAPTSPERISPIWFPTVQGPEFVDGVAIRRGLILSSWMVTPSSTRLTLRLLVHLFAPPSSHNPRPPSLLPLPQNEKNLSVALGALPNYISINSVQLFGHCSKCGRVDRLLPQRCLMTMNWWQ
jgi:hypothetical protein